MAAEGVKYSGTAKPVKDVEIHQPRQRCSHLNILNKLRRRKTPDNHVELFHWQPKSGAQNFGDHLSHVVVSQYLARRELLLDETVATHRRLLAVGSILHFARDHDVIWGSGINGKVDENKHQFRHLDVRAVRGPLTRNYLMQRGINVPEVYGDPVLLLPTLFPTRFRKSPKREYAFVPNLHDLSMPVNGCHVISPLLPWNKVVEEILQCEFVMSSSLHGLIVAEAFGIPACYVRLSETEAMFKFEDYYQGTGRSGIHVASNFAEARSAGGAPGFTYNPQPLMDAFPIDLWS